jgi:uracil-DNA glycosylase
VRGKKRIHQKPKAREVKACKGWLAAEVEAVQPRLIVCLGATAAQALLGPQFRLTQARGRVVPGEPAIMATYHPSALLRAPDPESRHAMYAELTSDLSAAAAYVRRT